MERPLGAPARPEVDRAMLERALQTTGGNEPVKLLGVRGYSALMGASSTGNDIGIWDDAIFLLSSRVARGFYANTDPSTSGVNPSTGKGYASLAPGHVYRYERGLHKGYPALVCRGPVPVVRSGSATITVDGTALNIHRGGNYQTTSEGCQTVWKPQWDEFRDLAYRELDEAGQSYLPYLLLEIGRLAAVVGHDDPLTAGEHGLDTNSCLPTFGPASDAPYLRLERLEPR